MDQIDQEANSFRRAKWNNVYLDAARMLEQAARQLRAVVNDPTPSEQGTHYRRIFSEINANIDAASARVQWESYSDE